MNLIRIWDLDKNEIDIADYGLTGLRLSIPSPSYEVSRESIPGRPGAINLGKDLVPRVLTAEFLVQAQDYDTSLLARDDLYKLFSQPFYIGEIKQPNKRWFVECVDPWTPDRISQETLTIEINLFAEKGVAESVETSLELNPPQISGSKIQKYKHAASTFEVLNDGDITINPRNHPLIVSYKGASTNLQIKNLTTGDTWTYTGTTTASDTIKLDGIRSTKNGLSIFRNTNKKLITLAPGWNEFELVGASGTFEILFDFRFYTL
jgi:phage-related protein